MINFKLITSADVAINEYLRTVDLDWYLLNEHNPEDKTQDRKYDYHIMSLVIKSKAKRQSENLVQKLGELKETIESFEKGDFTRGVKHWNEEYCGPFCGHDWISSLVFEECSYDDLPLNINKYRNYVDLLTQLNLRECIENYDMFMRQIGAMVILKRPYSEMLALFIE